jgi:hypothetical protein
MRGGPAVFVQVVQGRVKDESKVREQWNRWERDLKPGAEGFLGATGGIAEDGTFITVARFESEESAQRNSRRPEQDAWWNETSGSLEGGVEFHDCTQVELLLQGGSDDAGFVQIIQGRIDEADAERARKLSEEMDAKISAARPDLIGGLNAEHGDGRFTSVNYFTSEKEARKGESREMPPDIQASFDELGQITKDIRFIDLKDPWLSSP